jgi:hypothetical protein
MTTTEAQNFIAALDHIEALNKFIEELCDASEETKELAFELEKAARHGDITLFSYSDGVCVSDTICGADTYGIDEMRPRLNRVVWEGGTN